MGVEGRKLAKRGIVWQVEPAALSLKATHWLRIVGPSQGEVVIRSRADMAKGHRSKWSKR